MLQYTLEHAGLRERHRGTETLPGWKSGTKLCFEHFIGVKSVSRQAKHTEFHLTTFHPKSVQSHTQRVLLQPIGLHFSFSIFHSLMDHSGVL